MRVVSTSPSFAMYSDEPLQILREHRIEVVRLPAHAGERELIGALADADAIIVGYGDINRNVIESSPRLKVICKHGVGVDNIDLAAAREKGIPVTNVPDGNKTAVADYAFGLMLTIARRIHEANERTKRGEWPKMVTGEVYGKTLGVVGLGRIGKEMVRRAKGFDMTVLAFDPYPDAAFAEAYGVRFVSLEELLGESDFVTLHLPLGERTHRLIGREELDRMKSTAYLLNVSRGGLIDEAALEEALRDGKIAGCALDVFEEEPAKGHPLFERPNCLATSHVAGYTYEAINKIGVACANQVVSVLVRGEKPVHTL